MKARSLFLKSGKSVLVESPSRKSPNCMSIWNKRKSFGLILIFTLFKLGLEPALGSNLDLNTDFDEDLAQVSKLKVDATTDLIVYLASLLEHGVLGQQDIEEFILNLENGIIKNPLSAENAATSSLKMIHWEELQNHIQRKNIRIKRLLKWAQRKLKVIVRMGRVQAETAEETFEIFQKISFLPVSSGKFDIVSERDRVEVQLTHSFEMMTTPVTQKQWINLMGANPSKFSSGDDKLTMKTKGKGAMISFQADYPVEKITWWSALVFANELSQKMNLAPAYDLDGLSFSGTVEEGTLNRLAGELKINALNGNIYAAQGYRLPTEAEFEYVLRNQGKSQEQYPFHSNIEELNKYLWHFLNSGRMTHPVAKLSPFLVGNQEFFDLIGNVAVFTQDAYQFIRTGGVDPTFPVAPTYADPVVVRGGSYDFWMNRFGSSERKFWPIHRPSSEIGIRLVRSRNLTDEEQDFF